MMTEIETEQQLINLLSKVSAPDLWRECARRLKEDPSEHNIALALVVIDGAADLYEKQKGLIDKILNRRSEQCQDNGQEDNQENDENLKKIVVPRKSLIQQVGSFLLGGY